MIEKNQKVVVIGYGSVARCLINLLVRYAKTEPSQILVIERNRVAIKRGVADHPQVRFVAAQIDAGNLTAVLRQHLRPHDLLIDLAYEIDTVQLVRWCRVHGVLFLNTSLEYWQDVVPGMQDPIAAQTLYARQQRLRDQQDLWAIGPAPTCILEHGANPGLVSHFVKHALIEMGQHQAASTTDRYMAEKLIKCLTEREFARLAHLLEVQRIQITERDTQQQLQPRSAGQFVNTWSPYGFFEEAVAPVEIGWGTHEHELPEEAIVPTIGPGNEIFLPSRCLDTWVRSWLPSGEFSGMAIRHGELYSISSSLTDRDAAGMLTYRPTVIYAYHPTEQAIQSLDEVRVRDYQMLHRSKVIDSEIVHGEDELGVLLLRADGQSWWTGVSLSIDAARLVSEADNATTLQVAGSLLAAIQWMLDHRERGLLFPEDLPHDEILDVARPYIGTFSSYAIHWPREFEGYALTYNRFKSPRELDSDAFIH